MLYNPQWEERYRRKRALPWLIVGAAFLAIGGAVAVVTLFAAIPDVVVAPVGITGAGLGLALIGIGIRKFLRS